MKKKKQQKNNKYEDTSLNNSQNSDIYVQYKDGHNYQNDKDIEKKAASDGAYFRLFQLNTAKILIKTTEMRRRFQ